MSEAAKKTSDANYYRKCVAVSTVAATKCQARARALCLKCQKLLSTAAFYKHQRTNKAGGDCRLKVRAGEQQRKCESCMAMLTMCAWRKHQKLVAQGKHCTTRKRNMARFTTETGETRAYQPDVAPEHGGRRPILPTVPLKGRRGYDLTNCGLCDAYLRSMEKLILHLNSVHSLNDIKIERKRFANMQEFEQWRKQLELDTCAQFYKRCKVNETGGLAGYYHCSRSGSYKTHYNPQYGRRPPKEASIKVGYRCSAFIRVKSEDDGVALQVSYCSSHYGHDNYVRPRQPKKSKRRRNEAEELAAALGERPTARIVRITDNEYDDDDDDGGGLDRDDDEPFEGETAVESETTEQHQPLLTEEFIQAIEMMGERLKRGGELMRAGKVRLNPEIAEVVASSLNRAWCAIRSDPAYQSYKYSIDVGSRRKRTSPLPPEAVEALLAQGKTVRNSAVSNGPKRGGRPLTSTVAAPTVATPFFPLVSSRSCYLCQRTIDPTVRDAVNCLRCCSMAHHLCAALHEVIPSNSDVTIVQSCTRAACRLGRADAAHSQSDGRVLPITLHSRPGNNNWMLFS